MATLITYGVYAVIAVIVLLVIFQRNAIKSVLKAYSSKIADAINTDETKLLTMKADIKDKITSLNEAIAANEHQITNCKARNITLENACTTILEQIRKSSDELEISIAKKRAVTNKKTIESNNKRILSYENTITNSRRMIMLLEDKLADLDLALGELKSNSALNTVEVKQILTGTNPIFKEIQASLEHKQAYNEVATEDMENHLNNTVENVDEEYEKYFSAK